MRRLLYANLFTGAPASTVAGEAYTFPRFRPGEEITYAVRFLDQVNGVLGEVEREIASIRAGLGLVDNPPANGRWALQVGAEAEDTTSGFDWNQDSKTIEDALNAISGVTPHDFRVSQDGGSWLIWRTSGEEFSLTGVNNSLSPTSFIRVLGGEKNGIWVNEVRLVQASVAFTDSSDLVLPASPSISEVRAGGSDPSEIFFWNEIQKLTLPPDFKGSYYFKRGYARSEILDSNAGIEEIKTALDAILAPENAHVEVTNPASNVAFIEFQGDLGGTDVPLLEVVVASAPPGDLTFVLDLKRAEAWAALRYLPEVEAIFEVEVTYYIDPEDHDAGTRTVKLWSEAVRLVRPLLWNGLSTAQNIDWLRKPSPRTYVPFTPSQIITGAQFYTQVFGDGETTEFTFDHNLDTDNIAGVLVRENSSGGTIVSDGYALVFDDENSLTLTFVDPPDANELVIVIASAGPASVFQAHDHTMSQIVDLVDTLENLGSRVEVLEGSLASTGPGATPASGVGLVITLPTTAEVLHYRLPQSPWSESGLDLSALSKRAPYLLPAVHDNSTANNDFDPMPSAESNAGAVFNSVASGNVTLAGGGGIRSSILEPGDFAACDGRLIYPAIVAPGTNSYYPKAFERTLFTLAINDKMLAINRTLDVQFGVQLQTAWADCFAQWVLLVEIGTAPADTTPSPVGLNLEDVEWSAAPIFAQRIILTPEATAHFFGVRIKRESGGLLLDQQLYGVWSGNNDAAPDTANFLLRARLAYFDTENAVATARGWAGYRLIGALTTDDEGETTVTPAKAVIS